MSETVHVTEPLALGAFASALFAQDDKIEMARHG
jgi:hypothetical protein